MKRRKGQKSNYERVLLAGVQGTISSVSYFWGQDWRKSSYTNSLSEGKPLSVRDATDHCLLFPSAYFNKKEFEKLYQQVIQAHCLLPDPLGMVMNALLKHWSTSSFLTCS